MDRRGFFGMFGKTAGTLILLPGLKWERKDNHIFVQKEPEGERFLLEDYWDEMKGSVLVPRATRMRLFIDGTEYSNICGSLDIQNERMAHSVPMTEDVSYALVSSIIRIEMYGSIPSALYDKLNSGTPCDLEVVIMVGRSRTDKFKMKAFLMEYNICESTEFRLVKSNITFHATETVMITR